VKLLFEENLSPRLVAATSDIYPNSNHVRNCGLRGASDDRIWQYTLDNEFAIVSNEAGGTQQ
jgi:predicted nuclease of predicted toxin-antitoxin system